jgi:hypothetical protein
LPESPSARSGPEEQDLRISQQDPGTKGNSKSLRCAHCRGTGLSPLLSAQDIQDTLRVRKTHSYEIIKEIARRQPEGAVFQAGRTIRVTREAFEAYLQEGMVRPYPDELTSKFVSILSW